ncbi:hypothetical protein JOD31_001061 [Methylopila capsulata]|uniref:Uncharacterized protein n=1 Tax=Methylopila capsulata TaxID=61654 RepID=A0A9W6IVX6_9HYPH|nr:hypothetical protein [Methylopila capsulata]MBM7850849.1 hypothetical protein [Methylopila capsulata]GLK56145.1 hypothetical protein GCM10008170_21640 [Methylopila capsulata]
MKSAKLSYHSSFPWTPISGWAGARGYGWAYLSGPGGQFRRPKFIKHPFPTQRRLWCLLKVEFNGIKLDFATPQEVDHFRNVMRRKVLPSGHALVSGRAVGRPNNHWLSRLPKKAKPWKFREAICRYLEEVPEVREFRSFYAENPIRMQFEGMFDTSSDARAAAKEAEAVQLECG